MSAKRSLVAMLNLTGRAADSPPETRINREGISSETNTSMADAGTEVRSKEESRQPKRRRIEYTSSNGEEQEKEVDVEVGEEEGEQEVEDGEEEEEQGDVNDDTPLNEANESDGHDSDLEIPVRKTTVIDLSGNMLLKVGSPIHEYQYFQIAIETATTISPTFSQAIGDAFAASEDNTSPLSLEGDPTVWHNLLDLVSHITKFGEPPLVLPNDLSEAEDRAKQHQDIVEKTALDYLHEKLVRFRPIAKEWNCVNILQDWVAAWVARSNTLSEICRQISQTPYEVPFNLLLKWCIACHYTGKHDQASTHVEFVLSRLEDKVEHRELFDEIIPGAFRGMYLVPRIDVANTVPERILATRLRLIKCTIKAIKAFGNKEGDLSSSVPKFSRDREWADITLKSAVYGAFCLYIRRRLTSWELLKPSHFTSLHKTRKLLRALNRCIVNVVNEATGVLPGVAITLDSRYSPFYEILDVIAKGVAAFNMYDGDDAKAVQLKG